MHLKYKCMPFCTPKIQARDLAVVYSRRAALFICLREYESAKESALKGVQLDPYYSAVSAKSFCLFVLSICHLHTSIKQLFESMVRAVEPVMKN